MTHREALEYSLYQAGVSIGDLRRFMPNLTDDDARELRLMAQELSEMADTVKRTERAA